MISFCGNELFENVENYFTFLKVYDVNHNLAYTVTNYKCIFQLYPRVPTFPFHAAMMLAPHPTI